MVKRGGSKQRTAACVQRKVAKVMREFHRGTLHSGGPGGPLVRRQAQAAAIAYSEARQHCGGGGGGPPKPKTGHGRH